MPKINFIIYMLICLLLTIIVEVIVAYILKVKDKYDFINIVLVNILTNPLLVSIINLISINYGTKLSNICLFIFEVLVVSIEGLIYKKYLSFKKINPFVLSLILNVCSYLSGLLLYLFI